MLNIAVLVSGGGTNLQALLDAQADGRIASGRIAAVLSSSPTAGAIERARAAGVPVYTLPRANYTDHRAMTAAITAQLKALDIHLVVLAGFLHILTEELMDAYPDAVLNVHPSLIPAFCGAGYYGLRVHRAVLDYGVKLTGATVHFVNAQPDGGPVVLQRAVPVHAGDTPESLQRRVMEEAEWVILPEAVELFCAGRLQIAGRTVTILPPKEER